MKTELLYELYNSEFDKIEETAQLTLEEANARNKVLRDASQLKYWRRATKKAEK